MLRRVDDLREENTGRNRQKNTYKDVLKMKTRKRVILGAVAALPALLLAVYFGGHRVRGQPSAATVPAQWPMPTFDLETLDGKRFLSSTLSGKVALVDFWATYCKPCIEEIPDLNELYARYRAKGLVVLGVTIQSGWASDIKADAQRFKIAYPVVVGDRDVEKRFGGIWGLPTTFLVDRNGQIYRKYTGQYPQKRVQIAADVQRLLAAKPQGDP